MSPPRMPDTASGGDADPWTAYLAVVEQMAVVQGEINVLEAELVDLTRRGVAFGVSGGDNLPDAKWLAWKAGIAPERAHGIVRLAKRAEELPHTLGALADGRLTVDQAIEVARYVPARYDESAAHVATQCTVKQLRTALPYFRDPKPDDGTARDERRSVATGVDEKGWWNRNRLSEAEGAIFDQALKAMFEDLKRKAKAEAPDGVEPEPVTMADALVAMAETSLQSGEAARPGTDRYLVHAHLEVGPDGPQLMAHLGMEIPEGERRHILCDVRLRAIVHDGIAPIGVGRTTRVINRRMRRAIEHRDGNCSVPGCGRTSGLEIHHIVHWEDGGATETHNLIALCRYHHTCHHNGTLGIEGNADLARHQAPGVVFTNTWGVALDPVGKPVSPRYSPHRPTADASSGPGSAPPPRFVPPCGERLDRRGFHLNADPDWTPPDTEATGGYDDPPEPPPSVTGRRPDRDAGPPSSPDGPSPTDPTRAGPDAA